MSWIAVGAAVVGAATSIYGAKKNSDAIEGANDEAGGFQRQQFATSIQLARPQLEVANSALGQLSSIFGLAQPTQIDFDGLLDDTGGGTLAGPAEVDAAYRKVFGRPAEPTAQQYHSQRGLSQAQLEADLRTSGEYLERLENGSLPRSERFPNEGQQAQAVPGQGTNLNELVANNPLIQFNRQQGEQAIARGAAARGLNQSGGTLKDLSQFNQDLSGAGVQQFVLNPLFQLAGFGPQASAQLNAAGQSSANNLSNLAISSGQARGSAYQNAGNTIGNALTDFGAAYALNRGSTIQGNTKIPQKKGF